MQIWILDGVTGYLSLALVSAVVSVVGQITTTTTDCHDPNHDGASCNISACLRLHCSDVPPYCIGEFMNFVSELDMQISIHA